MRDGLTAIPAFLTLEMLEILRNRKCRKRRTGLADGCDVLFVLIGFQRGGRNGIKHVKIACQQIRIGRVKALIHLEIDACVLDFARSLVGVVFFKNDFFAALVRLQLVRAVADRFLPVFLGVFDDFGRHWQEGDVSDFVQERRIRRFEPDLQRGVVDHGKAG